MNKHKAKQKKEQHHADIWHTLTIEQVAQELNTSATHGLSQSEINSRYEKYGFNELAADAAATWLKVLIRQLADAMNWVFLILGIVCIAAIKDYIAGALLIILAVTNVYLSFKQDYAAEQTLAALRSLSSPSAQVIRGGQETTIDSRELVPGDLLLIKDGDSVAADARIVYLSNLEADEALLTGESVPVAKKMIILEKEGKKYNHV